MLNTAQVGKLRILLLSCIILLSKFLLHITTTKICFQNEKQFHRLSDLKIFFPRELDYNLNAKLIWVWRNIAAWFESVRLRAWVMACVRTCCNIALDGVPCCNAWAGTWTVSAFGAELGWPGWAGIVIWTGINLVGSVTSSWWPWEVPPDAPIPFEAWFWLGTSPLVATWLGGTTGRGGGACSMVLLASSFVSHKVLSSIRTLSSMASSWNASRTLVMTSWMTEW